MRLKMIILLCLISNIWAQDNSTTFLHKFSIHFLSGINSENFSEISGIFLFEVGTNVSPDLKIKLSSGYYKVIQPYSRNIKEIDQFTLNNTLIYEAISYNIIRKNFDIFPLSVESQLFLLRKKISPYVTLGFYYNIISTKIDISHRSIEQFLSYEDIPDAFKTKDFETLPSNSAGINLGLGTETELSKSLKIDLRYFYKFDFKIINTHQIVFGITF